MHKAYEISGTGAYRSIDTLDAPCCAQRAAKEQHARSGFRTIAVDPKGNTYWDSNNPGNWRPEMEDCFNPAAHGKQSTDLENK